MLYDKGELELSKWLYQTYGEKVFEGLDAELPSIKEYLNDNEIKMTDKKLAKLVSAKDWKDRRDLMNTAKQLMHAIGTEVYMDFNAFSEKIVTTAKALKLDVKATTLNAIARAMSATDPEAQPVIKKKHKVGYVCQYVEYEPDSDLRDTEKIPVKEDIYEYFQREVRPYVADAWINLPPTKIGCEISFNKYFYKPAPLRTLEENERDILELDRQSQGFIQSLFK